VSELLSMLIMCVILATAGMVQGVSGFGFGLLSVGLLALIWPDPKSATIIPLLPNLAICGYILWSCRRQIPWATLKGYMVGTVAGVPLGVLMLREVDLIVVYVGIGTLLIGSGVYGLLPQTRGRPWHRYWLGVPLGLLTGGLGGAFNTGGPPAIAFFSNQPLNRFQTVAALQAVFLAAGVVRLGSLLSAGMLPARLAGISMIGLAAALIGVAAGVWILHRAGEAPIQRLIKGAQLALGTMYFVQVWRLAGA
jgi:uncharacterized membrane protein YfcA